MMALTYREFEPTDLNYKRFAEIVNRTGDVPESADELRQEDQHWKTFPFWQREFIFLNDECIGNTQCFERPKVDLDLTVSIGFNLLPPYQNQGLEREILKRPLDLANSRCATRVMTNSHDDHTGRVQAIEELGFEPLSHYVANQLNLDRFDPTAFNRKMQSLEQRDITIRSATEIEKEGIDWVQLSHELTRQVILEYHPTNPPPMPRLEEYRRDLTSRHLEAKMGAFDGAQCVGMSSLHAVHGLPNTVGTGLTCVTPSYRRRGIATALKVACLSAAKESGMKWVKTHNEINNPMLQLNVHLGFEKQFVDITYQKTIQTPVES